MTFFERINTISKMLWNACQTGDLVSLAIISIASFVGCIVASQIVRENVEINFSNFDRREFNRKKKLTRVECFAAALAALYFVACFLSFAAAGWTDHELLVLHIVRSALISLLVYASALAGMVLIKAIHELLPVLFWCVNFSSFAYRSINALYKHEEPASELITDSHVEMPDPGAMVQNELRIAQLELQSRRALVEDSGLDVYEVEAIENQLKQAHLKRVRDILQQDERSGSR